MMGNAPERIWATGNGETGSWNATEGRMKTHLPDGWQTEYVRADLAPAPSWQPIETAPKDGSPFLTFSQDASNDPRESCLGVKSTPILVMAWTPVDGCPYPIDESGDWHDFHNWEPTHWMPLPAPPEAD